MPPAVPPVSDEGEMMTTTVSFDEITKQLESLELDVEELEAFSSAGVELAEVSTTGVPNILFALLVWTQLRRDGQPDLSWEEARRTIRVSLS
jgi:hypothetical protein